MAKSTTSFTEGNKASVTHSVHSVVAHGPSAMPVELQDDYKRMLANLGTHQGVLAELERQVGYNLAVATSGFAYLQRKLDEGIDIWCSGPDGAPEPVLKYLGSWANGCIRALTALAQLRHDEHTIDLAAGMSQARQRQQLENKDSTDEE